MGWGPHPEAAVAALPSSRLAEVTSASLRTTSSDSCSPTNKPLTSSLSLGLICCCLGEPQGPVA